MEEKKQAPGVSSSQSSDELAGEFVFRVRANSGTSLDDVKTSIAEGLARFEKDGFTVDGPQLCPLLQGRYSSTHCC